jgi:SpoVK/Ycf46/Vps4 family AAA+-type ATPase
MSRSRTQEHDAIRRAMTTLMLELDKLHPSKDSKLLIFGITNVPELIDTAVVRRFSLKKEMQLQMNLDVFNNYLKDLGDILKYFPSEEIRKQLFELYQTRNLTAGDVKNFYKEIYIDFLCKREEQSLINKKIIELFSKGFSTCEHLVTAKKELIR